MKLAGSHRSLFAALLVLSSLLASEVASAQTTTAKGSTASLCVNRSSGEVKYISSGSCKQNQTKIVLATGPTQGYAIPGSTVALSTTSSSDEVSVVSAPIVAGNYLATFTGFLDSYSVAVNSRVLCRMWLGDTFVVNSWFVDISPNTYSNYSLTGGFTTSSAATISIKCQVNNNGSPVPGPMTVQSPSLTLVQVGRLTKVVN